MSTRAFVLIGALLGAMTCIIGTTTGTRRGLAWGIIKVLKAGARTPGKIAEHLDLEDYRRVVSTIEEAFPSIQADIEWIYKIDIEGDTKFTQLTIYRTSVPKRMPALLFKVWGSYAHYFPPDIETIRKCLEQGHLPDSYDLFFLPNVETEMYIVERIAGIVLNALTAFFNNPWI